MNLQNGYKIMYEAKDRITEEKPGPLYANNGDYGIPSVNDAMLISYNNGATYVDCKQFKLIYSDGEHIFGSISGVPSDADINIVIKANDVIVLGKVIQVAAQKVEAVAVAEEAPVVEVPVENEEE